MTETWRFHDRRGVEIAGARLELVWEAHRDPISDDFTPDEANAYELLDRWLGAIKDDDLSRYDLPAGHVPIFWFVTFEAANGRSSFEGTPFCENGVALNAEYAYEREDFLTFFGWPVSESTGDRLNWALVPVVDKLWNAKQADKGGFIQQALGWKPSAYQRSFDPWMMAQRAGLRG